MQKSFHGDPNITAAEILKAAFKEAFTGDQIRVLLKKDFGLIKILDCDFENGKYEVCQDNLILKMNNDLQTEKIKSDLAKELVKKDQISFWDRWEFFVGAKKYHPELYVWNALELGKTLLLSVEEASLCLKIIEATKERVSYKVPDFLLAFVEAELGCVYYMLGGKDPYKYTEKAVRCFENSLGKITQEHFPYKWAKINQELGKSYRQRVGGNRKDNIEKAIKCYGLALEVYTRQSFPIEWGHTQHNLGNAYIDRIQGRRKENLEKAIRCFKRALEIRTRETDPNNWAQSQNSLGIAYCNRIIGNRGENLEKAIQCYMYALEIRTRETDPNNWAHSQNNLGAAYWSRIAGDRGENLEEAIRRFRFALEFRTRNNDPLNWAQTQNNLGNAYIDRVLGDRGENLEKAIYCCRRALEVRSIETDPITWVQTQISMGSAYTDRVLGDRGENLEESIKCYQRALEVYTCETEPFSWAQIQNNLGNVYCRRLSGDPSDNFEGAIKNYLNALQIWTEETFPVNWAQVQRNLGIAYRERIEGDKGKNLIEAVSCLKKALRVKLLASFPHDAREYSIILGKIQILRCDLSGAIKAFQHAKAADEIVFQRTVCEGSRSHEIETSSVLYFNAAWCLTKQNKHKEALEWLEQGKTRILSKEMAQDLARFDDIHPKDKKAYQKLLNQLILLEVEQRTSKREFRKTISDAKKIQKELDQLVAKIRYEKRDFLKYEITFDTMVSLVPDNKTAAIEVNVTEFGTTVFVFWKENGNARIETFSVESFKLSDLRKFTKNWTEKYGELCNNFDMEAGRESWGEFVSEKMAILSGILFKDTFKLLLKLDIKRLLIIPHRSLHILPLNLLRVEKQNKKLFLSDAFDIFFAPSMTVLYHAKKRVAKYSGSFVGVSDPTMNLRYAGDEIKGIQNLFEKSLVFYGRQANYSNLTTALPDAEFFHFSGHGKFVASEPWRSFLELTFEDVCKEGNKKKLVGVKYCSEGKQKISETYLNESGVHEMVYFDNRGDVDSEFYEYSDGRVVNKRTGARLLTLGEIFTTLRFNGNRLVVLSACESGLVNYREGADEFIGIPAAFLYAGAGVIVTSLWIVNDQSTCELMKKFYENYIAGKLDIGSAFRKAQNDLRKNPKYENPYYWAAFTMTGIP